MMRPVLLRGALVVVALLALGWLGVLYRDRRVGQDAADAIFFEPDLNRAAFERQMERLSGARLLDPDRYWELTRARYYLLRDRPRQALQTADGLLDHEPDNLDAWVVVYEAGQQVDKGRSDQAVAQIRRLNPLLARSR